MSEKWKIIKGKLKLHDNTIINNVELRINQPCYVKYQLSFRNANNIFEKQKFDLVYAIKIDGGWIINRKLWKWKWKPKHKKTTSCTSHGYILG